MRDKDLILNEIFKLTGHNLTELLIGFEVKNPNLKLKYKNIYKDNNKIIVVVFDENSECQFELYFNPDNLELEFV